MNGNFCCMHIHCFRKKSQYFKRGKKIHTAMKKKIVLYPEVGQFLVWKMEILCKIVRKIVRKQKSDHFVVLFLPYFLSNQSGIWYTIVFWSEFFEYAKRNCVSTLVFFYNLFKKISFFEYMGVGISASNWATELIKKPKESSWPT